MASGALSTLAIATLAGALRVSTPFLFVSLGECLTENPAASISGTKARSSSAR